MKTTLCWFCAVVLAGVIAGCTASDGDPGAQCQSDADCPAGAMCANGVCLTANGGTTNGNGGTGDPVPLLRTVVVGSWVGGAQCGDGTEIAYGIFLCPQGLLRGVEVIDGNRFLTCGSWQVNTNDEIVLDYTATAVVNGDTFPGAPLRFTYNAETGNLEWVSGCSFPLQRLIGETLEADCTSGFCGDVELTGCGTDCDCGHCWYCEDGTCRYGGEGPFGCFRGCPF